MNLIVLKDVGLKIILRNNARLIARFEDGKFKQEIWNGYNFLTFHVFSTFQIFFHSHDTFRAS